MTSSFQNTRRNAEPRLERQAALALGALLLALASAAAASAEVRVQVTGTQVDLKATAAPLSEVLDRLARLTGMKLVFEGSAPRPLVTISVHGRSPAQTVLAVLEGLGINYALLSDATGTQVQTLLVTGSAAPSSSPATGRSPSPARRANRNMPISPEPVDMPLDGVEPQSNDEASIPGTPESDAVPADVPPDAPSAVASPGAVTATPGQIAPFGRQPQPYAPGPFPAPTPTAPPQAGQGPEAQAPPP